MKSVCIIGAGPAGLVTAKTLIQSGAFKVTIYEQSQRIGGIWSFENKASGNAYLASHTPTNLSRFTVGFSDLSWTSLYDPSGTVPLFPPAVEVEKYLSLYQKRYIPLEFFHFGHRVVQTDVVTIDAAEKWSVTTQVGDERQTSSVFDYLVNAAGFFHSSQSLTPPLPSSSSISGIHTSMYRKVDDLFESQKPIADGKILLIGGGNSSGETAAAIAFHLSSSSFSAATSENRNLYHTLKLHHVTPRPLYVVPPFTPMSSESCRFAPLDLLFYDLKWRPNEPIYSKSGALPEEAAQVRYEAIQRITGDQRDLGAAALVTTKRTTPYVALSESYSEYVRSGSIIAVAGRVTRLSEDKGTISATIRTSTDELISLDGVVAVVYANGYTPHNALSFLPNTVTQLLDYDPSCTRLPILLQNHQTINPKVPNLAFVGFYEGPYWGVMEMQARAIVQRWSSGNCSNNPAHEELDELQVLRAAIKSGATDIPQYWFSDYAGYLEELARDLGLRRVDSPFNGPRDGPVTPARYLAPGDDEHEAQATMEDMKKTLDSCQLGRYRARAAFRALQGIWQLKRRIVSKRNEMPSGTFTGTGSFHPRIPTEASFDLEHLYIEDGSFLTDSGITMTASRRYVYRYREANDTLSVWFVDADDGLRVDYLFHELSFSEVENSLHCKAHAEHLCEEDFYVTDYTFSFRTISLEAFEIQHAVRGPHKDYVASGRYIRV